MKKFFEGSLKVISFLISSLLVLSIGYTILIYVLPVSGHFVLNIYNTVGGKNPADGLLIYLFPMLFLTLVFTWGYIKLSKGIFKYVKKFLIYIFNKGVKKSESVDILNKKGKKQ